MQRRLNGGGLLSCALPISPTPIWRNELIFLVGLWSMNGGRKPPTHSPRATRNKVESEKPAVLSCFANLLRLSANSAQRASLSVALSSLLLDTTTIL
jgi:hypothetical protein